MRKSTLAVVTMVALLAALAATAFAQESGGGEKEQEEPPWISADLAASDYAPPGPPPGPWSRVYDASRKKVWKKLVRLLKKESLVLTSLDKDGGSIQTDLKIFDEIKGPFHNVATRPPTASRRRPIRQMVHLDRGRYTLDIKVSDEEEGTKVSIETYIEERAFHVGEAVRIWAQRYSNGTIEAYFLDRLEEAL